MTLYELGSEMCAQISRFWVAKPHMGTRQALWAWRGKYFEHFGTIFIFVNTLQILGYLLYYLYSFYKQNLYSIYYTHSSTLCYYKLKLRIISTLIFFYSLFILSFHYFSILYFSILTILCSSTLSPSPFSFLIFSIPLYSTLVFFKFG